MEEVWAKIKWDFVFINSCRLRGTYNVEKLSFAQDMAKKLNEIFGEGTHWVEAQNTTYEERDESYD